MTPEQFQANLQQRTAQLKNYFEAEFPRMAARKAIRFIDGNFRAQGWQGAAFQKWKANIRKGTVLIKTGRLRRSTKFETGPYSARIYNDAPYARHHNRGFKGTVTVAAHTRNRYTAVRVGTGRFTAKGNERTRTVHQVSGTSRVRTHTRRVNNPRRQFMPESINDSPVLYDSIKRDVVAAITRIFN